MHAKDYFEQVPKMLERLNAEAKPAFGVMTPQHMLEHLIWVTKSSIKNYGPAPDISELSKGAKKFMQFVESGAPMKYIEKNATPDDLNDLRLESIDAAKEGVSKAIDRLINDYNGRGDSPYFNPMMGVISPDQMLSFHHRHYVHHLEAQYGLSLVED